MTTNDLSKSELRILGMALANLNTNLPEYDGLVEKIANAWAAAPEDAAPLRVQIGHRYRAANEATILIQGQYQNKKYRGIYSPSAGAAVPVTYNYDGTCAHVYDEAREWDLVSEL